jgi:histidinol-phosphate aminotransferase
MCPSPVSFTLGSAPGSYRWEATDEEVAARYGLPVESILRFDRNTSPAPPDLALRVLGGGRFVSSISEYPPADYRALVAAAAERYGVGTDEILVGAGADEVLDISAKAFLPPGGAAVVPTPTYAMFRVLTEQRPARPIFVPRLAAAAGYALDLPAIRAAARSADLVWLCSPNNPTGLAEPDGTIDSLLGQIAEDTAADDRRPPVVVLDEAYAEFVGRSLAGLRSRHANLIVVRTASKAYALAGLRVGFAIATPQTIERLAIYRPPGSVSTTSVTVVTEALRDPTEMKANLRRVAAERARLGEALQAQGWSVGPSVTNFLLVGLGSADRASAVAEELLRRGIVPRTFGAGHPLLDHLRLTVHSPGANDRLIAAAKEIG